MNNPLRPGRGPKEGESNMEMETFLKEFGKQLKSTRKQMGLSQVAAAQNMHIDYRHYQNIEGGKINLRLDTLIKLVKFYSLDKATRPFNVDACMDLLTGFAKANPGNTGWERLKENFVNNNHAGFLTFNVRTKAIDFANNKLAQSLGYRGTQDIVGKPMSAILVAESVAALEEGLNGLEQKSVSKPLMVTFRTQPPAFPIPMMAVVCLGEGETANAIFFDRKSLDEDGARLSEMLNGYQQFMQLYPQLKAV